jgi:hypothetical protein
VAIAVVTAAGVGIAAIAVIREISQKNDQIHQFEAGGGPITRSVGGTKRKFDVNKLLIDEEDQASVPGSLTYEDDDHFYWRSAKRGLWSHDVTNELDHMASILGLTPDEVTAAVPPEMTQFIAGLADLPLHRWRRPDTHRLTSSTGEPLGNSFTFVTLERIGKDELIDRFERTMSAPEDRESIRSLKGLLDEGRTSAMLQLELLNLLTFGTTGDTTPVLQTVDMRKNAAYLKLVILSRNVKVDGKPMSSYYDTSELIILDLPPDIVLITTNVPTGPTAGAPTSTTSTPSWTPSS